MQGRFLCCEIYEPVSAGANGRGNSVGTSELLAIMLSFRFVRLVLPLAGGNSLYLAPESS
jgi:hypothetical protein